MHSIGITALVWVGLLMLMLGSIREVMSWRSHWRFGDWFLSLVFLTLYAMGSAGYLLDLLGLG